MLDFTENLDRLSGQGYGMSDAHLHLVAWNGPHLLVQIELLPFSPAKLTRADENVRD
jgi:hypothetical protein